MKHDTTHYDATIVADSVNPQGDRITSMLVTYPRIVHAEMCRHRIHSRNTASSRAIPFKKMVKMVKEHPFIPIAWQKDHSGMQGTEYFTDKKNISWLTMNHLKSRDQAIERGMDANERGLTKQLCNRLLEPFVWVTELITATEWDNFFNLRCPQYHYKDKIYRSKKDFINNRPTGKHFQINGVSSRDLESQDDLFWLQINKSQADIHVQKPAEMIWDAMNESKPIELQPGEWHIPFGDNIDLMKWLDEFNDNGHLDGDLDSQDKFFNIDKIKIATARSARTSYINYEGKDDYSADLRLHHRLLNMKHMSPFEHCAKTMSKLEYELFKRQTRIDHGKGWCRNFRGFIQYRHLVETGSQI